MIVFSSNTGPLEYQPIRAQQIFSRPIRIAHFTHVTYVTSHCPYLGMVLHVTHRIKNTRTQELNPHSLHSFNDRVKPGYKRDVCDALMTSRPFFTLKHEINRRCLLLRGRSHEWWMRPFDIVVVTCVWPWFDEREFDRSQSDWNKLNGGMVRSKKQTEWETVDHWHARGGGLWSNDWLKKNRPSLQTGRVWRPGGVTPLKCLFTIIFY